MRPRAAMSGLGVQQCLNHRRGSCGLRRPDGSGVTLPLYPARMECSVAGFIPAAMCFENPRFPLENHRVDRSSSRASSSTAALGRHDGSRQRLIEDARNCYENLG